MNQGSLVDAFTGEELIKHFALFDRKTQTQADYLILGDRIYIASVRLPGVTVNIKELPSFRSIREYAFKRHIRFVEHEGKMYHVCQIDDSPACIFGYEENEIIYKPQVNEEIISVISSDRLLVSTNNDTEGVSYIKDAINGDVLYSEGTDGEFPEVKLRLHAACYSL
jgi:hypothetical protein